MEFIKEIVGEDARYGIITVQPDRAVKKCRIRNLRIEYFLSRYAVMPILPESCEDCESFFACAQSFGEQIVVRYLERHKDLESL